MIKKRFGFEVIHGSVVSVKWVIKIPRKVEEVPPPPQQQPIKKTFSSGTFFWLKERLIECRRVWQSFIQLCESLMVMGIPLALEVDFGRI